MACLCDLRLFGGEFGGGGERRITCSGGECWEIFWEEVGRGILVFEPGGNCVRLDVI
jgi:hypothetical protein